MNKISNFHLNGTCLDAVCKDKLDDCVKEFEGKHHTVLTPTQLENFRNIFSAGFGACLEAVMVSGIVPNQQIHANETVEFDSENHKDTHCAFDKSIGRFTAPVTGEYSHNGAQVFLNRGDSVPIEGPTRIYRKGGV